MAVSRNKAFSLPETNGESNSPARERYLAAMPYFAWMARLAFAACLAYALFSGLPVCGQPPRAPDAPPLATNPHGDDPFGAPNAPPSAYPQPAYGAPQPTAPWPGEPPTASAHPQLPAVYQPALGQPPIPAGRLVAQPFPAAHVGEAAETDAAPAPELPRVEGRVTHVTLYRDQALVTRTIELKGPAGNREIVVGNLPPYVVPQSLFAEGNGELIVRAVRFRQHAVANEPREAVRKLDEQLEKLNRSMAEIDVQLQVLDQRTQYLAKLEGFVAPTATAELKSGVLDAETIANLTKMMFEQQQEIATGRLALHHKKQDLQKELSLVHRQREEITRGSTRTVREAVLFLDKQNGEIQHVRLNYLVANCHWIPTYTIRGNVGNEKVHLEYSAQIAQVSGEDWSNVKLTLSTASPGLSNQGPGLAPLMVSLTPRGAGGEPQRANYGPPGAVGQGQTGLRVENEYLQQQVQQYNKQRADATVDNRRAFNFDDAISSAWSINMAANGLQELELLCARDMVSTLREATVSGPEQSSITYELKAPVSLASRADQQLVRILQAEMPSSFYYVATPLLTNSVYREAEVTNDAAEDLLGGSVQVYLDGRFVGRGELPTIARGETFVVGFGADPQLRASRELASKTEGVQGGNREMTFEYRIAIENFKQEPVAVRVFDRLPQSGNMGQLRVTLGELSDKLSDDKLYVRSERTKGLLRWEVTAPASATRDKAKLVEYQYKLEFDRNFDLTAFRGGDNGDGELKKDFERQQRDRAKF